MTPSPPFQVFMSRVFMSRFCLKTARVVMEDILVFAGSARTNAFSKKLAEYAALSIRRSTPIRARATLIDLADFDVPLFNADLKFLQGVPESMQAILHNVLIRKETELCKR